MLYSFSELHDGISVYVLINHANFMPSNETNESITEDLSSSNLECSYSYTQNKFCYRPWLIYQFNLITRGKTSLFITQGFEEKYFIK